MPKFEKGPSRKRGRGGARKNAGRKPKAATVAAKAVQTERLDDADWALSFVIGLMRNTKKPDRMRLDAAQVVMDRVWGKPKQAIELGEEIVRLIANVPDGWQQPPEKAKDARAKRKTGS